MQHIRICSSLVWHSEYLLIMLWVTFWGLTIFVVNNHFWPYFFFTKMDQKSNRTKKDAISRLSPCENSCGTDAQRPTVLEHFIIVALMLYDSQAAGKCLHFMTRVQSQISLSLPALSLLSVRARTRCLQSTCSEGLSCWAMQNWLLWKEIALMHLTSVGMVHPSPCQKFSFDQSWGRTRGSRTN